MIQAKHLKLVIYAGLFVITFVPFLVSSSLFFPFITTKAFTFRIVVEVIFAAWAILALLDASYRPKRSPILWAVLAFLAVIGLADLLGAAPGRSFWSNFERMEGYLMLLHLGALFLVAGSVFKEIDWKRWFNTSLVASGFMVVYALFQLAGALRINQGGVRVDGTLGNASYLAGYLLIHFFLTLFMLWREKKSIGLRWVYGLLALSHLFILYNTATRGAILGVLGGLLILALLNLRNPEGKQASNGASREAKLLKKLSAWFLVGLVVLVGGFFAARNTVFVQENPVLERFANLGATELKSGGRAFVWPMALEGVKDRPILGWGQENFSYVFQKYYDPQMYQLEPWFDRAHNIFLDWAVAGGVLGLLAYLSLYTALLYMLWKPARPSPEGGKANFSHAEKSIITALVAAYFFHNFFVFDNLISYFLFFSMLAYVHSRGGESYLAESFDRTQDKQRISAFAAMAVVALVLTLYFVNWRPMSANTTLIEALKAMQLGEYAKAAEKFEKAHSRAPMGRSEISEQVSVHSIAILQSNLSMEDKNEFFNFARSAVIGVANDLSDNARYQIVAGSLLARTGQFDEAEDYLLHARELMPYKQIVYHELGNIYINQNNYRAALEEFRKAYELAPGYSEAKVVYLAGAIYAGELSLERRLIGEIDERVYFFDNRILATYYEAGRIGEVVRILKKRIELDPANEATHRELLKQVQG